MPFRDSKKILKPDLFKTEPYADIRLLLGEDPHSVLILRNLTKYMALLAAGVVIATSIVLKDIPLICINLLLTLSILFYQVYKLWVNKDERFRFIIESILILVAAGMAAWLAYPLLVSAPITYITALIFANYVGTVINIAAYISGFFSPFIVHCLQGLARCFGLKLKHEDESSKFEIDENHQVALENLLTIYSQQSKFDLKEPLDTERNIQKNGDDNQKKEALRKALNKAIRYLDNKLKKVQARFFSSELHADKIAILKKSISDARKGYVGGLLTEFRRKRISQGSKKQIVQTYQEKVDTLSKAALQEQKTKDNQTLNNLNIFLTQNTTLAPIKPKSKNIKEQINERTKKVEEALREAKKYHTAKFKRFNDFLTDFNMPLVEKEAHRNR